MVEKKKLSLSGKMAAAMGEMSRLKKTGFNSHYQYKFATDADVSDLVRAVLAKQGIAFEASMEEIVSVEQHGKQQMYTVRFLMKFRDSDSDECREVTWFSQALDAQDKGLHKAATAGVKYFLLKQFLVSTGDLADETDAQKGDVRGDTKPKAPPPPTVLCRDRDIPKGASDALSKGLAGIVMAGGPEDLAAVGRSIKAMDLEARERQIALDWYKARDLELRNGGAGAPTKAAEHPIASQLDDPPPWDEYLEEGGVV